MLQLAGLRKGETLYDLGAGDGRLLVLAAREFGANPVGVEIDPQRVSRINNRIQATGIQAKIIQKDFMNVDVRQADVVAFYLSDAANKKLAPKLRGELRPGARVVSLDYELPDWGPAEVVEVKDGALKRRIYLYTVK